jgi:hypothetical protein
MQSIREAFTPLRVSLQWLLAACVIAVALPSWAADSSANRLERSVKAAFLYKFVGYVEWPEGSLPRPDTPVAIGVIGAEDIAAELQQLAAARGPGDRPVIVRRLKEGDSSQGLHILFIGTTERGRLGALIRAAQQRPVLIITETEGALALGSAINFVLVDGRVRFEVALDAAERNSIKLSSRMLAVAQTVRPNTQ